MNLQDSQPCSCKQCVNCCKASPCIGTPQEIKALIDSGYEDVLVPSLIWDQVTGKFVKTIQIRGDHYTMGGYELHKCVLLDASGKCKLHDQGLKPLEGRVIDHNFTHQQTVEVRHEVLKTWEGF